MCIERYAAENACATLLVVMMLSPRLDAADPALTIYNQNFAVVRETIALELKQGTTPVAFTGITAHLEPESVVLRDPAGKRALQILEQNYRADPVAAETLLSRFEGQTIEFLVQRGDHAEVVRGRIVRASTAPRFVNSPAFGYAAAQQHAPAQPIIEVDGKLRFQLPGIPLFPSLADDTILKPTINWLIQSTQAGKLDAELTYVSGGMTWSADYNLVQSANDALDLVGWVTMENQSGREFENARIKLMAGDVNKVQPNVVRMGGAVGGIIGGVPSGPPGGPPVAEKTFDEYHLYTLQRPATLHDRETKQVEFVRAQGISSKLVYVYDGAKLDGSRYGWQPEAIRNDPVYGTQSNPKVWVMREFLNSDGNHLGIPLPRGRVRFYCRDTDGRLEFTGEDNISHTPRDETVRVFTGAAFDLVGERRRVNYRIDHGRAQLDESFEIKVRNRKIEAAEVRILEHLYRWTTWEIQNNSLPFERKDAQTVEFKVELRPGDERVLTYNVHYTW